MAQAWRTPLAISRPKTLTLAMCDCDSCRMYGNQCACKGDCGDPQCRALSQDALGQCDWTKCRGHNKKHPAEQFCRKCWRARWPQEWGIVAILPPPPPRHRRQHQLAKEVASCHHQVWVRDQIQHQLASPGTSTWRPNPAPAAASLAKDLCSAPLPMLSSVSPWSRLQFPLTMWSTPRFTSRPTKS